MPQWLVRLGRDGCLPTGEIVTLLHYLLLDVG
jgi:hypothetical protein